MNMIAVVSGILGTQMIERIYPSRAPAWDFSYSTGKKTKKILKARLKKKMGKKSRKRNRL